MLTFKLGDMLVTDGEHCVVGDPRQQRPGMGLNENFTLEPCHK